MQIQKHEQGNSPLERLPTEVLSEIVNMYLFDDGEITTITHICNRIRQVVFGMASLWRGILILTVEDESIGPEFWYEDVRIFILHRD
jgi:hypothetical protein